MVGNNFTGFLNSPIPGPVRQIGTYSVDTSPVVYSFIPTGSPLDNRRTTNQPVYFPVISSATSLGLLTQVTVSGFVAAYLQAPCLDITSLPCTAVVVCRR